MRNRERLRGVVDELVEVIDWVDAHIMRVVILEGLRTRERQAEYVRTGKSKTLDSPHLNGRAVDTAPDPIKWGDWPKAETITVTEARRIAKERARFYYMAGAIKARAASMGVSVRWGGDWDGDGDFFDQDFNDLVHTEVTRE